VDAHEVRGPRRGIAVAAHVEVGATPRHRSDSSRGGARVSLLFRYDDRAMRDYYGEKVAIYLALVRRGAAGAPRPPG
jgi:hypothetical protein